MSSADDECVLCDADSVRDLWSDADLTWYQCHQCSERLRKTRYLVCQGCKLFHKACLYCKAAVDNNKYEACDGNGNLQALDHHSGIQALSQGPYQDTGSQDIGPLTGDDGQDTGSQDTGSQAMGFQPWPLAPPGHFAPQQLLPQQYFPQPYFVSPPLSDEFIYNTLWDLHQQLGSFSDYLVHTQDKWCPDRENREVGTMRIVREVPVDMQQLLSSLCTTGTNMAEHLAREDSGWTAGILVKLLVLSQASEKEMLILQLIKRSSLMIYGPRMCYVASQITMEAEISPAGSGVAEAAHCFFMAAHANGQNHEVISSKNLLKSMQHKHANYSFQGWVTFLGKSKEQHHQTVMGQIVDVAQGNLQTLLMCPMGMRTLLRIFESDWSKLCKEGYELARACTNDGLLETYVFNKFANHCIQSVIVQFQIEWYDVSRLVVGEKFEDILWEEHANYVLKAFIQTRSYKTYLLQLAEKFLKMDPVELPEEGCPQDDEKKVQKLFNRWKGIADLLVDKLLEFRSGPDWYPWRNKAEELKELVKEHYEIYLSRFPELQRRNAKCPELRSSNPMSHGMPQLGGLGDWVEG